MPGEIFQLFVVGAEQKTKIIRISEDASIKELMVTIHETFDIDKDADMRVVYTSKDIRERDPHGKEMCLKDYKICDEANLYIVFRLRGGSIFYERKRPMNAFDMTEFDDVSIYDTNSLRHKKYNGDVELTNEPDMFTLDDSVDGQRTKMSCGHTIGPESLTDYCRSQTSVGRYEIRCPYKASPRDPFCNTEWEFSTIKRLAVLTKEERKEFEKKIAENYLRKGIGIQDCPKCRSFCERQKKTDQRVICPVCTQKNGKLYEFCWFCLKTWLSNSINDCGNVKCKGEDPRLILIKSCETKTVVDVECPAIRACPSCGMLIEHTEACKHMSCRCTQKFCFICLKKSNSAGAYQCGAWNYKCTPAPRQTTMPGQ